MKMQKQCECLEQYTVYIFIFMKVAILKISLLSVYMKEYMCLCIHTYVFKLNTYIDLIIIIFVIVVIIVVNIQNKSIHPWEGYLC